MTDRELLQQALDAIDAAIKAGDWKVDGACDPTMVIEALRARLAQPEHEPVAWRSTSPDGKLSNKFACKPTEGNWVEPLYTAPPKREWVGLTDDERREIFDACETTDRGYVLAMVGAKLKEKNHG